MFGHDQAIVLQVKAFRETGFILKCYLRDRGIRSFLIQGVRGKSKRKKHFQLLSHYDLVFYDSQKSDLNRIKEISPLNLSQQFFPERDFVATFCSELFIQCVKEEEVRTELFELLLRYTQHINGRTNLEEIPISFCRDLFILLGIFPGVPEYKKTRCFDLLEGELLDPLTQQDKRNLLELGETSLFIHFLGGDQPFATNGKDRHTLLKLIMRYFDIHLPGFKEPKSLEVLHAVLHG